METRTLKTMAFTAFFVAVGALTLGYASLTQSLNINSTASVQNASSSWNIKFTNGSAGTATNYASKGTLSLNDTSATVSGIVLKAPKDSVTYTWDVTNAGQIDAELAFVHATTPKFTGSGATKTADEDLVKSMYEYALTWSDNTPITEGAILNKGETKHIKLVISYKESATQLPTNPVTIGNLGLVLSFVQKGYSNDVDFSELLDSLSTVKKVSMAERSSKVACTGSIGMCPGDEIALGNEHFYIVSNDGTTVNALAKYNLKVGKIYTKSGTSSNIPTDSAGYGLQDPTARGIGAEQTIVGTLSFSSSRYWSSGYSKPSGGTYLYIYDSNSNLYTHVENYKNYLNTTAEENVVTEAKLMSYEQVKAITGVSSAGSTIPATYSWIKSTSYWLGSADSSSADYVWYVFTSGYFDSFNYTYRTDDRSGVRPLIVFDANLLG